MLESTLNQRNIWIKYRAFEELLCVFSMLWLQHTNFPHFDWSCFFPQLMWGRKCGIGNCCYISRYYSLHKAFRHPFENKTIKPAINYLNVFSIWHQKLFNFWKPNQLIYNVKTSLSFRPHVVLYHSLCGLDSIYWRTSDLVHLSDVPESWYFA